MRQLINYQTINGDEIFFEIASNKFPNIPSKKMDFGNIQHETDQVFNVAKGSIENSLDKILSIGEKVSNSLKKLEPQKIEVEFGLTFTVESGVIITSVSGEANFKINLTWENK